MNKPSVFKIGTRGSLLAVTQSTLVKNFLEQKTGHKFELKTIKTQGDLIQDKPLWQLDGKDFFTKELDTALLNHEVDLVIHSYKDLGSIRPKGIELGAMTKRSFSNDILLVRKDLIKKLAHLDYLKIGTSSPRRIVNVESSLKDILPNIKKNLRIKCHMLRGNVNTRIEKLKSGQYDGIVLAMAGLERLAHHPKSSLVLKNLLTNLDFMILPESHFPSAAAQGALGIEVATDHPRYEELRKTLATIHDPISFDEIKMERKKFAQYGGGCHLAVGIFTKKLHGYYITYEKGISHNKIIDQESISYRPEEKFNKVFVGLNLTSTNNNIVYDELINKTPISNDVPNENLFITSRHTFHNLNSNHTSLWASGVKTWQKLAKLGFWVRGSSDSLGHNMIDNFSNSKLLKLLLESHNWQILTRKSSRHTKARKISCYEYQVNKATPKYEKALNEVQACYWMSFNQYLTFKKVYPSVKWEEKKHFAGLGKTFEQFKEVGINIKPTLSLEHFKTYLK